MSNASSSDSSQSAISRLHTLENKVTGIEDKLSNILSLLESEQGPAAAPLAAPAATDQPAPTPSDPVQPHAESNAAAPYYSGILRVTLPTPSADAVSDTFATRQAYSETGKLNKFQRPSTIAPFPAKRFVTEPEGLFGRIKSADLRDGWEAEVLWNIGNNLENALTSATEHFAVLHHFLEASYHRVLERVDFFTDSLESGKSEAILLQRYLREDDLPYSSELYRSTKTKFAELRSQAYAKEFNKQAAQGSRGRKKGNPGKGNREAKSSN